MSFDDEKFAEQSNPFQSPEIEADRSALGLNSGILEALRQTRPWVLLIAVVCFVVAGLAIIGGIFGAIGMMAFQVGGGGRGLFRVGIMVFYVLFGALYIVPGLHLLRYAGRIKALMISPTTAGLEEALIAQKSFWKFAGVAVGIIVGLYGLLIVVGIFVSLLN